MDDMVVQEQRDRSADLQRRDLVWRRVWPAALGVLVAVGTMYGLNDGRDAAPVIAASGLVYLAASATGRRWTAWAAFGIAFGLITADKFTGLDATPWVLALAAVLVVVGLAGRRTRPGWSFPLQTVAMLVLGGAALIAIQLDPVLGGLLVAAVLLGHAGWDIHHHRTDRVVPRSLAEFCAVLDILVATLIAVMVR